MTKLGEAIAEGNFLGTAGLDVDPIMMSYDDRC